MVLFVMVLWGRSRFDGHRSPHVSSHPSGSSSSSNRASSYRYPAFPGHQTAHPLRRIWRPFERRDAELLEDSVSGDALQAIVTDLASEVSQGSGLRVRWCHGLAVIPQALDEAHGSGSFLAGKRT
jgi:hypothetical protein